MAHGKSLLGIYWFSLIFTFIAIAIAVAVSGPAGLLPVFFLAVIETTFSFDNAVLNSHVLAGMSTFWQKIFLTIGIAIAVFGVRLILPISMVAATSDYNFMGVIDLALNDPDTYSHQLEMAYPLIAAFGGMFLLMIGLRFFGAKRKVYWIRGVEESFSDLNKPWHSVIVGALVALAAIYFLLLPGRKDVALAGILGASAYILIKSVGESLLNSSRPKGIKKGHKATGKAAFMAFLYLELLDASFSFDGVVAAFAITKDVVLIAAGLGIGAIFVRSITIHLLHRGTLVKYRYIVHGAHYAITTLAVMMLLSIRFHVPEALTGALGIAFIIGSIYASILHNRKHPPKAISI